MMEDELVRRRKWLSRENFLDLLGASNLLPGPSSSELAIHIGYLRAGWAGLLLAGACFILPAACMAGTLAWAYVHFGKLPATSALLYGVKPVVIAVILQALWGPGRTAIKTKFLASEQTPDFRELAEITRIGGHHCYSQTAYAHESDSSPVSGAGPRQMRRKTWPCLKTSAFPMSISRKHLGDIRVSLAVEILRPLRWMSDAEAGSDSMVDCRE